MDNGALLRICENECAPNRVLEYAFDGCRRRVINNHDKGAREMKEEILINAQNERKGSDSRASELAGQGG